jgi:hypothetical protein
VLERNAAYLDLVTCTSAGDCVTVGDYPVSGGAYEGLIETGIPRHG